MFDDEQALLNDSDEIKYGINETRPNLTQYYNALWSAGFSKIDIFPYQTYEQTNSDIEVWSEALCITEHDIDHYLDEIFDSIPQKLVNIIKSSRRNILKNTIMAKLSSEVVILAEKG